MIRIAIVEDDTGYRSQLESTLTSIKAIFRKRSVYSEFSDGLEIVEKYKSEYDIILMDIQMKHMDGMQALRCAYGIWIKMSSLYLVLQNSAQFAVQDIRSRH